MTSSIHPDRPPERGIHSWLISRANYLRHHVEADSAAQILASECACARRPVPQDEILATVRKAFGDAPVALPDTSWRPRVAIPPRVKLRDIRPDWDFLRGVRDRVGVEVSAAWLRSVSPAWSDTPWDYLAAIFRPGDRVACVNRTHQKRPIWWSHHTDRGSFHEALKRGGEGDGAWYLSNPVTGQRGLTKTGEASWYSEDTLARLDHAVLESDAAETPEEQGLWLTWLCTQRTFPIRAIYTSGGKSVHALVLFEAASIDEWNERMTPFRLRLARVGADPAILQPRRLTRLPGVMRESKGKRQTLLYLCPSTEAGVSVVARHQKQNGAASHYEDDPAPTGISYAEEECRKEDRNTNGKTRPRSLAGQ